MAGIDHCTDYNNFLLHGQVFHIFAKRTIRYPFIVIALGIALLELIRYWVEVIRMSRLKTLAIDNIR